jgi:hypothetical protein
MPVAAVRSVEPDIFASHNANLVVNGDAELVAWCDYRTAGDQSGGKIFGEGAIDVPDVRDAIKNIMEGGEERIESASNRAIKLEFFNEISSSQRFP